MRASIALLSQASVVALMLGGAPAHAQVSGPPEVVVPAQAEEDLRENCDPANVNRPATCEQNEPVARESDGSAAEGQTITITGSRIRLPNLESFEPTTTLDGRQIQERNFTNVADALNELPGVRGSVTPAGGQGFGQGVNFINNYGLGSNRTLTLINGRRFVSSNVATIFTNAAAGTQVDLNVIPAILVDRIDTVSVGGAPIYGSDAISGTVNVILRSQYDGIELIGTSGITEEGDNGRWNLSGLIGRDFFDDRLNVTFAVAHDEVDGVVFNQREFLRRRIGGAVNPSDAQAAALRPGGSSPATDFRLNPGIGFNNNTTDFNPGVVLIRGVNIPYLTPGGLISATNLAATDPRNPAVIFGRATTNGLQFDQNGNLVPFNQGVVFPGTSGAGGEGFRFSDYTQIESDLRRTIFNGFLTFDITDNIEFFAEGTHFRSRADELTQQPTFNSSLFGGLSGQLFFSPNNPFLNADARQQLIDRGVTVFGISRASDDFADLTGYNETRINRGVAGIRGNFEMFGRSMNFEAYANRGKTKSNDFRQDLNAQNFVNAVNVTQDAQGQIVCTTAQTRPGGFAAPGRTPIADPNCVPLDAFGRGRASQAALDYVIEDTVTRSEQEQTVYSANVGGTLFDIWGGPIGFNVGYEHRDEAAAFRPDEFTLEGRGRAVPITGLEGKYNLDEVFGEILLPLVSPETGLPFLESAQVYGRGRYVDNTVNGGFFSYAVGGTVAPIPDLEFRGNYTRSFRSPAITELFLPTVNTFAFVPDLCSRAARNAGPVPEVRARNCEAFIARFPGTEATPDPASLASVPAQSGGNPDLMNEEADSYTIGAILRPRFLPRFAATLDYISITLNNPIANLSVAQIASGCFDNEVFNTSDPLNGNAFCSQINRDPNTGRVIGDPQNPAVRSGFVNGQQIQFRGIQGTVNYGIPITALGLSGNLSLGGDMLYVRKRLNNITGVAPARSDGTIGDPEFSGQFRVRYAEDTWGLSSTVNYVGEQLFSRFNRAVGEPGSGLDAREIDELDDYVTVGASAFFDASRQFRMILSVTNLFNRQGQEYFGELMPASFNDLLGRRFSASARLRF